MLTGVVGTPVVLTARNSSLLVEPLPDCAPVYNELDIGLGWPEEGGAFAGWLTGTPSSDAWTFACAMLEATDTPFLANNRIACTWRNSATIKLDYGQGQVFSLTNYWCDPPTLLMTSLYSGAWLTTFSGVYPLNHSSPIHKAQIRDLA